MAKYKGNKPLLNSNHEKFATYIAEGFPIYVAYLKSGYNNPSPQKEALSIMDREEVILRINYLKASNFTQDSINSIEKNIIRLNKLADNSESDRDRISAIKELTKLAIIESDKQAELEKANNKDKEKSLKDALNQFKQAMDDFNEEDGE